MVSVSHIVQLLMSPDKSISFAAVYNAELVLTGALRQQLDLSQYPLPTYLPPSLSLSLITPLPLSFPCFILLPTLSNFLPLYGCMKYSVAP